jgi:hypothetical protein
MYYCVYVAAKIVFVSQFERDVSDCAGVYSSGKEECARSRGPLIGCKN